LEEALPQTEIPQIFAEEGRAFEFGVAREVGGSERK
jgi:hypothetical protein